jgi:hypothetical protein
MNYETLIGFHSDTFRPPKAKDVFCETLTPYPVCENE